MWTQPSGKSNKRFSYLLLEEGDHYRQDWLATCRQGSTGGSARLRLQLWQPPSLKGRLRLSAKCLFFEPEHLKAPILMFRFSEVKRIGKLADAPLSANNVIGKWGGKQQEIFVVEATSYVKMKEEGLDAPYTFEKKPSIWWFSLDYAPVSPLARQVEELLNINALPDSNREMVLQNAASQRECQAKFDTSRLVDLSEHVIFNCPAAQVTPLVREPGRLVLTESRVYFQPLHNFSNDNPVRSHPYSLIVAVARRRHALRHTGIEVFFKDEGVTKRNPSRATLGDGASVFYTFVTVEARDSAFSCLLEQLAGQNGAGAVAGSLFEANGLWLHRVTSAWQAKLVSNFDYLLYLNLAAGRSFCDLTQWPVMPWVIKDYSSKMLDLSNPEVFRDLSKAAFISGTTEASKPLSSVQPIGALNTARLAVYKERYAQMPHDDPLSPPFLYGTHYSTPGYVLYWVVRAAPAHMLRLQNGRFDSPDRLFVSIAESWDSVLTNPTDLKELIPEFFVPPSDFLMMRSNLNLGVRQNGSPVGDVTLPPWAKNPDDFIAKHREALESEHVSAHLHEWIDLIFGFKQRGEAALAADNLFHHLTYEGAVDLDTIDDPVQRAGLEAQINEFGQAPRQLFTSPHPAQSPRKKGSVRTRKPTDFNKSDKSPGGLSSAFLSHIMALVGPLDNGLFGGFVGSPNGVSSSSSPDTPTGTFQPSPNASPIKGLSGVGMEIQGASSIESATEESPSDKSEIEEPQGSFFSAGTSDLFDNISPSTTSTPTSRVEVLESPIDSKDIEVSSHLAFDVTRNIELHLDTKMDLKTEVETYSSVHRPVRKENHSRNSQVKGSTPWHWMFRQRLSEPQPLKIHRGPVNALALSAENASESLTMYSVGQDGFIKVYSITEGFQVRATKLGNLPLAAIALGGSSDAYPTVLAGSYDDCVYAYSVDYGRALGKIRVHDDAVSCIKISESYGQRMITGSWDATVKVWSIAEGRGGWAGLFSIAGNDTGRVPESELYDHEAAVWSLDVASAGSLAVAGAEDGAIVAWDLRTPTSPAWQLNLGDRPVAGLKFSEDSNQLFAASDAGTLHVLDVRHNGAELATKDCGSPLKCCDIAGSLVIAGSVNGAMHFWPYKVDTPEPSGNEVVKNEFLDYSPIRDHKEKISCIAVSPTSSGSDAILATSSDDCSILVYSTGQSRLPTSS